MYTLLLLLLLVEFFCISVVKKVNLISACHANLDVEIAVADCMFDICASSENKEEETFCQAVTSYVTECKQNDEQISGWREQITECGKQINNVQCIMEIEAKTLKVCSHVDILRAVSCKSLT
jgi:hypothetical protein